MKLNELLEKRAKAVADARTILDAAQAESRDLTDEESAKYDALMADAGKLADQIKREQQLLEQERAIAAQDAPENRGGAEPGGESRDRPTLALDGFRSWLRGGAGGAVRADPDGFQEFRDLSAGVDTEGGFLVTPERFVASLIKKIDDMVYIRGWATVQMVAGASSLGAPSLDADPDDADWTTELGTGREDDAMKFGKRELHPHPLAKRIKISNDLLRRSVLPAESIVRDRLAYKFAITQEKAFLLGHGAGQPLGVFVASDDGISARRDVSADNDAAAVTFDGLQNAKFALKAGHRRGARWMFHRDGIKQLGKIKDADGRYIWQESHRVGEPDRLLGLPYFESEFVPNTFTTGTYVGILGDFSYYWIADDIQLQMQRLAELYAETNQIGIIARAATDAMPVLEEAFVRVQLG